MSKSLISFNNIDWDLIPKQEFKGEKGKSYWQVVQYPGLRIRIVEYSKGFFSDHWCTKGHIVHCLEGEFSCELKNGENYKLTAGKTFVVSDDLSSHSTSSLKGAKLLIIDGDFLK